MLVRPNRSFPGTLFMIKGSAIQMVWKNIVLLVVVATVLTLQYEAWDLDRFSLTLIPFQLVGLALSIFLGFRNNACYDRWWEARKLWGALVNTSRDLARQVLAHVDAPGDQAEIEAWQRDALYRIIAFVYALKAHLRQHPVLDEVAPFLPAAEVERLRGTKNVPYAIVVGFSERLTEIRRRGWVHPYHVGLLDESVTKLIDILGACERIKKTPVPLSYTVLTHRLVAAYCFALPFGIVHDVGPLTPVVVGFVGFAFLGLDSVGTQLEDPFEEDPNDLPLAALSRTIEIDVRQLLGDRDLPEPVQPVGGVLL